ncbi:MAG: DUF4419 domain-containing protein [Bacteroidales bacterium]|nr:DUF4419 domain-containing protein [Bacteroidales bacterium]
MNTDIILDKHKGSITFIVDKDLPEPEDHIESVLTPMEIAEDSLWEWGKPTVYATSKCEEGLYDIGADTFYQTLLTAYAEHRPVVISPDMIWCLICQGFSRHINLDPEKYRDRLVFHQGKNTLEVKRGESKEFTPEQWEDIIREFAQMVDEKTKGSVASAIVTDFSTTTPVEAISSRITLLDTVKSYFEFVVIQMICGIPHITLKGTPQDWQKIADNVQEFRQFDLDWWVDSLSPILEEFVKTANGQPDPTFWKSIVMTWRTDLIRGGGCIPSDEEPTKVDGWFLKFFPYCKDGRTPDKVSIEESMLGERVSVPFILRKCDTLGNVVEETKMKMTAGMIGVSEDRDTYALTPKFGWFISRDDSENNMLKKLKEESEYGDIHLKVEKVPEILKDLSYIHSLWLDFTDKVYLPEWMDDIKIDNLTITGLVTRNDKADIMKRFPKCYFI